MSESPQSRESSPPLDLAGLYEREHAPMIRLACLLVGSRPVAEEIVQDAFVVVGERWAALDKPGGYLRSTVVNGCRMALRRRATERRYAYCRPRRRSMRRRSSSSCGPRSISCSERGRAAIVLRYFVDLPDAGDRRAAGLPGGDRAVDRASIPSHASQGVVMTEVEDRLRADLPRLAELIATGPDEELPVLVSGPERLHGRRRLLAAAVAMIVDRRRCHRGGGDQWSSNRTRPRRALGSRCTTSGARCHRRRSVRSATRSRSGPATRFSCGVAIEGTRRCLSRCRSARPTTRRRTHGEVSPPTSGRTPAPWACGPRIGSSSWPRTAARSTSWRATRGMTSRCCRTPTGAGSSRRRGPARRSSVLSAEERDRNDLGCAIRRPPRCVDDRQAAARAVVGVSEPHVSTVWIGQGARGVGRRPFGVGLRSRDRRVARAREPRSGCDLDLDRLGRRQGGGRLSLGRPTARLELGRQRVAHDRRFAAWIDLTTDRDQRGRHARRARSIEPRARRGAPIPRPAIGYRSPVTPCGSVRTARRCGRAPGCSCGAASRAAPPRRSRTRHPASPTRRGTGPEQAPRADRIGGIPQALSNARVEPLSDRCSLSRKPNMTTWICAAVQRACAPIRLCGP